MSDNPYESPRQPAEAIPAPRPKPRWPAVVLGLCGGFVVLTLMLLPSVRTPREAARRMQCANNLKQISLALWNYEEVYHGLPPAYTVDEQGRPLHSWRTLILPYMEERQLYDQIDLSKPWDDPANAAALAKMPSVYRCPSSQTPPDKTCYLAVVGAQACFLPDKSRKLADITDDHSATLMVVDVGSSHAVPWMAPSDADETLLLSLSKSRPLPHSNGFQTARVDGAVVHLREPLTDSTMRAMITIAGNDGQALE